jgi:hypothetical protein
MLCEPPQRGIAAAAVPRPVGARTNSPRASYNLPGRRGFQNGQLFRREQVLVTSLRLTEGPQNGGAAPKNPHVVPPFSCPNGVHFLDLRFLSVLLSSLCVAEECPFG